MKVVLTSVLGLIAYIGCVISCIWAIVEFLLHLAKDKIFNWWSVWMIVIFAILSILMIIISAYFAHKKQSETIDYYTDSSTKSNGDLNKKSKFQQKLEEAINRQKENQEMRKNQNQ